MSTSLYRRAKRSPPAIKAYKVWKQVVGEATGLRVSRPTKAWVDSTLSSLKAIGDQGTEQELEAALNLYVDSGGVPSVPGFRARSHELVQEVRFASLELDAKRSPKEPPLSADAVYGAGLVHNGRPPGKPENLRQFQKLNDASSPKQELESPRREDRKLDRRPS